MKSCLCAQGLELKDTDGRGNGVQIGRFGLGLQHVSSNSVVGSYLPLVFLWKFYFHKEGSSQVDKELTQRHDACEDRSHAD